MKFSYSAIIASTLLIASVMTAPVSDDLSSASETLSSASITIINSTSNVATHTTRQPATADAMSGNSATASIAIMGQDVTAQSSGATSLFVAATVALPLVIISSLVLM